MALNRQGAGAVLPLAIAGGLISLGICTLGTSRLDVYAMEGIIAWGGEHMFRSKELFVPRLYGEMYAYKPALAYWLAGASMRLLGHSESALRLPTALCGVALCLTVFALVARLVTPRCGLYASLSLSLCVLFFEQARIAGYDIPLALGVGVAMAASARNLVLGASSLRWWMLAYTALVFGFLAKGLPAFGTFGVALIAAAVALRQFRQLLTWQHLAGVAWGGAILAAYLYLSYREVGVAAFADHWAEVSYRSTEWDAHRILQSLVKPFVILAAFLPSSALLPWALSSDTPPTVHRLARLFWWMLAADIGLWMCIPTASTRYYLPLITPVAVLAALGLEKLSPNAFGRDAGDHVGTSSWITRLRENFKPGIVLAMVGLLVWLVFAAVLQPLKAAAKSERRIAAAFASHLEPGEKIYIDTFDTASSLFWYLNHPVQKWRLTDPPIADRFALVLVDQQRVALDARADLRVQFVESGRTPNGPVWLLARVSRVR